MTYFNFRCIVIRWIDKNAALQSQYENAMRHAQLGMVDAYNNCASAAEFARTCLRGKTEVHCID